MKNAVIDSKIDISHKPIGQFEETRFEKIHNVIFQDSNEASIQVAHEIAALIKKRQGQKKKLRFGFSHRIVTDQGL
jgi:glucosamine-6-phosphate deaminase